MYNKTTKEMKTNITTEFKLFKNGKVTETCYANALTKEIYPANSTGYGYNAICDTDDDFFAKYGKDLKQTKLTTKNNSRYLVKYYSDSQMNNAGFKLVFRGSKPLF